MVIVADVRDRSSVFASSEVALGKRVWAFVLMLLCMSAAVVQAQTEETEPRVIARPGTTLVGFSGYVDRFFSSQATFPINYTAQLDVCRFVTKRVAIRGGVVGSGSVKGDTSDDLGAGSGAPSMHALAGVLYYFTPDSIISAYVGGEYWAQLTQREGRDSGSLVGIVGMQATMSSRASVFVQGGIGGRVNRGEDDELLTRFVAQVGLRIKL
jgi:hypothetical protein